MLNQYSGNLNAKLESAYAEGGGASPWLAQAQSDVRQATASAGEGLDRVFHVLANNVSLSSSFISRVLTAPDNFNGKTMAQPSAGEDGVFSIKAIVAAEGDEKKFQNINDLRILSNAEYAFASAVETNHDILSIYYTAESGLSAIYANTNQYPAYLDMRETEWYQKAVAEPNVLVWSGPQAGGDSNGTLVLTAATTAHKPDGSIAGVVAGNIALSQLLGVVGGIDVGSGGKVFLINKEGLLIGEEGAGANILEGTEGNYAAALEQMVAGQEGTSLVEIDGKQKIFSYRPLSNGLILGLYRDVEELKAAEDTGASASSQAVTAVSDQMQSMVRGSFLIGAIVMGAVLLLIILAAILAARTMAKKIAMPAPMPPAENIAVSTSVTAEAAPETGAETVADEATTVSEASEALGASEVSGASDASESSEAAGFSEQPKITYPWDEDAEENTAETEKKKNKKEKKAKKDKKKKKGREAALEAMAQAEAASLAATVAASGVLPPNAVAPVAGSEDADMRIVSEKQDDENDYSMATNVQESPDYETDDLIEQDTEGELSTLFFRVKL